MTTDDFNFVRALVRVEAAIVLEPGKEYLVESRLQTLARREKLATIEDLVAQLRANPTGSLFTRTVEAMTTNETSFFRDLNPFEALKKTILPGLIARRSVSRQLNFWCGAASTGQEPYSVMMLIAEHFPELLSWDLRFIATDLSTEVLTRARAGRYSQLEINRGLPAALLVKYFVRHGSDWEIREDLRRRVDFRELNLVKTWPAFPPLDVVFLRNVLIYFDVETKRQILGRISRLLRADSYLLLGGAEAAFNIDASFELSIIEKTSCYQLKQPVPSALPGAPRGTPSTTIAA